MSAGARSLTWLVACVCSSLLACGGDSTSPPSATPPPDPSQASASSGAFYVGTLRATFQAVDVTFGNTQTMTAILPEWVLVQAPFTLPNELSETNPFHLELGPGTAIPPRPAGAPPLPPGTPQTSQPAPGSQPTPGELFFASATLQPNPWLPQSSLNVVQSWQYACDPRTNSFAGQLQSAVAMDLNNLFASAVLDGPGSLPPNSRVTPCLGAINAGAIVTGFFSGNQLEVNVQGTAGGVTQGPTCGAEFQFTAQIIAKTSQGFGVTCGEAALATGFPVSDGIVQP